MRVSAVILGWPDLLGNCGWIGPAYDGPPPTDPVCDCYTIVKYSRNLNVPATRRILVGAISGWKSRRSCRRVSKEDETEGGLSEPKTSDALLKALRDAPCLPLSAEDVRRQRVSFVVGFLGAESGVTRTRIEQIIDRQEGRKAS